MLVKQMTDSFKQADTKNGLCVDDVINRLDSGTNNNISVISPTKMSSKMKEIEKLAEHNKDMQNVI